MLAVRCTSISRADPLSGLTVGDVPEPEVPDGWVRVHLRAAALNHHDLWSLRGVGLDESKLPMILGTDGAGALDDGTEVVVHCVIADPAKGRGDETLDPGRTMLSELHQGTLAEQVVVPARNAVPKPASLGWEEGACVPTAWVTAYRMVAHRSGLPLGGDPGTVLVQGAGGGVATAAIAIAKALGHTVFCTSRAEDKRVKALKLGADLAVEPGARLPQRVDAVIETVGEATWSHSMRALRPGGTIVVSGSTTGPNPPADLQRLFFLQLRVVGSTMGTREELVELLELMDRTGLRPEIASSRPLAAAADAFAELAEGEQFGKIVLTADQ